MYQRNLEEENSIITNLLRKKRTKKTTVNLISSVEIVARMRDIFILMFLDSLNFIFEIAY